MLLIKSRKVATPAFDGACRSGTEIVRTPMQASIDLTGSRLSPLMREIVALVAVMPAEEGALVEHLVLRLGGSLVTDSRRRRSVRASLSRALRRLWRRGVVELHESKWADPRRTMSARQSNARRLATEAQADPEGFYQERLAFHRMFGSESDPLGSPRACLAEAIRHAERTPWMRIVRVTLTTAGRELVNSPGAGTVNRTVDGGV